MDFGIVAIIVVGAIITVALVLVATRTNAPKADADVFRPLLARLDSLDSKLGDSGKDLAQRLGKVEGDLSEKVSSRLNQGFLEVKEAVDKQLAAGRAEQQESLKAEIAALTAQTRESLGTVSGQVEQKLGENIRAGIEQFQRVQDHLKATEEQLKNVGTIGASINDLNNLLKMPHLRGKFGEASLERLLEDFLPAHMYAMQSAPGENGTGRADAVIKFPGRNLPIDAKFPREQVLPLFENSDATTIADARVRFAQVMKEQGRRIAAYIQPENGTTDMALMYLPSETLYMETILNGELTEWLNKQRVFPVSPNTLIVMLGSIQMVFEMYKYAKNYEKATEELRKAQSSLGHFERQFDEIGRQLSKVQDAQAKAQDAFGKASTHLNTYKHRVTELTGEPVPELAAAPSGDHA
ncbi:MAG TPA: DNA recombination protein RmuC [Candidatus Binataceae bacterium]|nr:DNA recombination protein RmuC [Candidatus Binataceae bacterium]